MFVRRIAIALASRPSLFIAGTASLAGVISILTAALLYEMRSDAMLRAQEFSENITLILERDIARNIETYDLSLQAVVDAVHNPHVMGLPPEIRQLVLFDRSSAARDLGSLLVANAQGSVFADSRAVPPRSVFVGDRDYFAAQKTAKDVGLFISKPFLPRVGGEGLTVGLSRRLNDVDGKFSGIVVGTLRVSYYTHLFEGVNVGAAGTIALSGLDGTLYASWSSDSRIVPTKPSPVFAENAKILTVVATSEHDGVERLLTSRRIEGYPLAVTVGLPTQDIYRNWRYRAMVIGSIVATLNVLLLAASVFFAEQLRKRFEMERQLETLANTDGLTGLATRRAFDAAFDSEWRRANRTQQPLGVLMIDVDEFKQYNDHYGHAAGDVALRMISRCILDNVRRPGDIAGRYGGEEFCVVLPSTDQAGTLRMAEKIRGAIEAKGEPHAFSRHGRVTVSIGAYVYSGDALGMETTQDCLSRADEYLYAAKSAGRNCVMSSRPNQMAPNAKSDILLAVN